MSTPGWATAGTAQAIGEVGATDLFERQAIVDRMLAILGHVIGLVWRLMRADRVGERRYQQARTDEVEEERDLVFLKRRHLMIGLDDGFRHDGKARGVEGEIGNGIGDVENERAVDHVAEIDDAGDARIIEDEVMFVNVGMDQLRPHPFKARQHIILQMIEDVGGDAAMFRPLQEAYMRQQARRHPYVPQQFAVSRCRMETTAHGATEPRHHPADVAIEGGVLIAGAGDAAIEIGEDIECARRHLLL